MGDRSVDHTRPVTSDDFFFFFGGSVIRDFVVMPRFLPARSPTNSHRHPVISPRKQP